MPAGSGRYPSGQRGQTVNLLANAFGGSNPPLPTIVSTGLSTARTAGGQFEARVAATRPIDRLALILCGNSSAVERQPSKLGVAGSNPVSRSMLRFHGSWNCAHVAQSAERVLGKDEVSGSIPDMGSIAFETTIAAYGGH